MVQSLINLQITLEDQSEDNINISICADKTTETFDCMVEALTNTNLQTKYQKKKPKIK